MSSQPRILNINIKASAKRATVALCKQYHEILSIEYTSVGLGTATATREYVV